MTEEPNICQTKNKKRRRGRPRVEGQSIRVTVRFREGKHDEILKRLSQVPKMRWSAYIRRVLEGAPVEVLDEALVEDAEMGDALDTMWESELGDEWD